MEFSDGLLDTGGNSHFDTLSWIQAASADGTIPTVPDITWFDHSGKHSDANGVIRYEVGTQALPSTIARIMPDGTVWYKKFTRNNIGNPLTETEYWTQDGTSFSRLTTRVYDSTERYITQVTDPLNRITRNEYQNNRLYRQITALNETNEFLYDTLGRVSDAKYFTGRRIVSTYTPITAGSLTNGWTRSDSEYFGTTPNSTSIETREWNIGLVWTNRDLAVVTLPTTRTISTDARGLVVTRFHDALDRLIEERTPTATNRWWHEASTIYANSTSQKLILGVTLAKTPMASIETKYDNRQRVIDVLDNFGIGTHYEYCTCGSPSHVTEDITPTVSQHTYFQYDYQGKRKQITYPDNSNSFTTFDLVGRTYRYQDAFGYTTNVLDNLGRAKEVRNANGLVSATTYDSSDQVTVSVDSSGVAVTNSYNANGRLLTTVGNGWTNAYGYTLNVTSATLFTNALGKISRYAFDAASRKTNEVQVGVWTNSFVYSSGGDLRFLYDGNNNQTEWKYDSFGRVSEKWYQGQSTADLIYTYDQIGRMTNKFTRTATGAGTGGYNTGYGYDANNNLTTVTHTGSPNYSFSYDGLNRLTSDTVVGGIVNSYSYAPRGGLATESSSGWASSLLTIGYTDGLRTSLSLAQPTIGSWTHTYQYDAGRRLTNLLGSSGSFPYTYAPAAGISGAASRSIAGIGLPVTNGTASITNLYDNRGRMTNSALIGLGGTTVNRHGYNYNSGNQVQQQTRTDLSYVTYTYDDGGKLGTGSSFLSGGGALAAESFGYAYDPAHSMLRRTNNTSTTVYPVNALNQVTNGPATYLYDRRGNRTSSSNNDVYLYDSENQLIQYYNTSIGRTDFIYDARLRLRVRLEYVLSNSVWVQTTETRYLYDGTRVIQERNSSNTPQVTYTRGPDLSGSLEGAGGIGGLLSRTAHSGASGVNYSHAFYHADRGGNVTYLLNAANTFGASYKYDPFGTTLSSSGTLSSANTYRFSSKEFSVTPRIYCFGYRFYDPSVQRWLNRDPIGELGGLNLYSYIYNSPINFVDPQGLQFIELAPLLLQPPPVVPPVEVVAPRPVGIPLPRIPGVSYPRGGPFPPEGTIENPSWRGSFGRINPETGKFEECWRYDPAKPGGPRGEDQEFDHLHYWRSTEHLRFPPSPPKFKWFIVPTSPGSVNGPPSIQVPITQPPPPPMDPRMALGPISHKDYAAISKSSWNWTPIQI